MKLQDYIHYYIGCKMVRSSHWEPQNEPYILHFEVIRGAVEFGDRPLLRRLEDMTEDEGVDLAKLQHNPIRHKNIEVLYVKTEHLHYIDGTRWSGDGVSEYNEYFVDFSQMKADQFHYLLSKGFDLFGLIDAGLAVDVKTITNE